MRKVIYGCDKCGKESEKESDFKYIELITNNRDNPSVIYQKLLCNECYGQVRAFIDYNWMVIDPDDLRSES